MHSLSKQIAPAPLQPAERYGIRLSRPPLNPSWPRLTRPPKPFRPRLTRPSTPFRPRREPPTSPRHAGESRHPRLSLKRAVFKNEPPILKTVSKALLFLKKKKQKNFCSCGPRQARATAPRTKSFLLPRAGSLFFKKEALSSLSQSI
jgi:hypothetical protein